MRKNKMMRIASILLVVTLLSTCAISGAFAKYVTKAEGEDAARVAKWGVLLSVDGGLFADKYEATDEAYLNADGQYSVEASVEGEQVVAPGTSSDQEEAGGPMVATVKGTPEVATRYTLVADIKKDVVLPAGTYTDYTNLDKADDGTYGYIGTFTLAKAYAPVKWDITISKGSTSYKMTELLYDNLPANLISAAESYGLTPTGCSLTDAVTIIKKVAGNEGYKNIVGAALGQVVSGGRNFQLEAADDQPITLSYDFDANKEMDFTFALEWSWDFDANGFGTNDKADTYLGNVAAGVVTDANANTTLDAAFTATATQID